MTRHAAHAPNQQHRRSAARRRQRAFTVVEILIVIGVVLILLSILTVAINQAMRGAQRTNTQALMNSIRQGLVQFEQDMGYLPPVLNAGRNLAFEFSDCATSLNGPDPLGVLPDYQACIQEWHSVTSIAEYLIGSGRASEVGHGVGNVLNPEESGMGIRNPGSDGYWGVGWSVPGCVPGNPRPGTLVARHRFLSAEEDCQGVHDRYLQGQVYGPYIGVRDERLLGLIDATVPPDPATGEYHVIFPGEAGYDPGNPDLHRVIVDRWGQPIRYYRKPYPAPSPGQAYRAHPGSGLEPPTLGDVYVLRPWRISGRDDVDNRFADEAGDTTSTYRLQTANFALLSAGPDRRLDVTRRVDEGTDYNEDNVVELGP